MSPPGGDAYPPDGVPGEQDARYTLTRFYDLCGDGDGYLSRTGTVGAEPTAGGTSEESRRRTSRPRPPAPCRDPSGLDVRVALLLQV